MAPAAVRKRLVLAVGVPGVQYQAWDGIPGKLRDVGSQVVDCKDLRARQLAGFENRVLRVASEAVLQLALKASEAQSLMLGVRMGPVPIHFWSSHNFHVTWVCLVWLESLQLG